MRHAHVAAVAGGPSQGRRGGTAAIQKDFDARTSPGRVLAERLGAAPAQRRQHALDVLAGAEPVDAMIDAIAGIGKALEAADLHLVEAAAAGLGAERAENRMVRFERLDGDDFSGAPPAAQRDLVLVGGPPALRRRRPIEHGAGLFGDARYFCVHRRG